jgi:hypothetical protein
MPLCAIVYVGSARSTIRSTTRCTTGGFAAAAEVGEAEAACGAVPDVASGEVWEPTCPEFVEGVEIVVAARRASGVESIF